MTIHRIFFVFTFLLIFLIRGYTQASLCPIKIELKNSSTFKFDTDSSLKKYASENYPSIEKRLDEITSDITLCLPHHTFYNSGNKYPIVCLSTISDTITQPLVIVNNFPFKGDITDIKPEDVESIKILKPSESAIYGVNGMHGVIAIEIKKRRRKLYK